MQLILVRHAEPVRTEASRSGAAADPPLSQRGLEEANSVAQYLKMEPVHGLVQSPSRRATETAGPLAEVHGLKPRTLESLVEFDHGATDYLPIEEMKARKDLRYEAISRGEIYGMDPAEFRERVARAFEEIIVDHPGRTIAVVTHAGVINAFTAHIAGQARTLWIAPAMASISRVTAGRDGRRSITSLNETAHLRLL